VYESCSKNPSGQSVVDNDEHRLIIGATSKVSLRRDRNYHEVSPVYTRRALTAARQVRFVTNLAPACWCCTIM
jgi:hypothetical protein